MNRTSMRALIRNVWEDELYAERRKTLRPFGLLMLAIEELFYCHSTYTDKQSNRHVARAIVCLEDWLTRE